MVVEIPLLYDESHEEPEFERYYSILSRYLTGTGTRVDVLSALPITKEALNNHSTVIVSFPQKGFTEEEISSIVEFVQNGGGLFLVGEEYDYYHFKINLNSISTEFNIKFNDDEIRDSKNKPLASSSKLGESHFTIREFIDHPITRGLEEFVFYGSCSLKVNGKSNVILKGSEYSYSSEGYYSGGQFPPVLSVLEFGKGKVVCLGDGSILRDTFINEGNNQPLVLNIINWLSNEGDLPEDEKIRKEIEDLERLYSRLDELYSLNIISSEEYERKIQEFGQELIVFEHKIKVG